MKTKICILNIELFGLQYEIHAYMIASDEMSFPTRCTTKSNGRIYEIKIFRAFMADRTVVNVANGISWYHANEVQHESMWDHDPIL